MKWRFGDGVVLLARLSIGGVLLYAGFMKAAGPSAEFAAVLEGYKLFPPAFLSPMAIAVPYLEMWTGLFLLAGLFTRQAALASAFLLICFLASISSALLRGIDLASCGCFGAEALTPRHTLIMDAVLLILALTTVRLTRLAPPLSLDRAFPKT